MPETTPLGYPYPEDEDSVQAHLDIQALAEAVDESPGVSLLSQSNLDNAGGDAIRTGRLVFNTTESQLEVAVDANWLPLATRSELLDAVAGAAGDASSDLAAHTGATTSVHGIADTADLATKEYADGVAAAAAAAVVEAAPETLNTLQELAAALGDDADFATTVTTALGGKASLQDLADHEADTTGIHGIANTAALVVTTDSRLSNARTPTSHAASHAQDGADPVSPASIGAATAGHGHEDLAVVGHEHPYAPSGHGHDYAATDHSHTGFVPLSTVASEGDLIVGVEAGVVGRLPAGPDGYIMQSVASGSGVNRIAWVDPFGNTANSANLSDATPQPLGTASAGIAVTASRSDHVHEAPPAPFGGIDVAIGGAEPTTAAGYVWLDTTQEA